MGGGEGSRERKGRQLRLCMIRLLSAAYECNQKMLGLVKMSSQALGG